MTEARCHTYYSSEYSNQFTYRHTYTLEFWR